MPTQEIDDFTALTTPAAGDLLPIVDVSDTTDSPQGTTKKIAVSDLVSGSVVPDDSVSNAKLANMAQATIKGRASGAGTGDPTDLSASDVKTILALTSGDLSDFGEAVEDKIGVKVVAGTGISVAYNDTTGETTVTNSDPGSGVSGAPADATYITQTPSSGLSNEQAMSALATGIVKNTTTTGVQSIADVNDISSPVYAADAGSTDAYAITLSPAPSAYQTGTHYRFKANTANTGACTLNVNSLGAKTIKKAAGGITTDLADNDIRAGQFVDVVYDGTNMQMQSTLGNAASGGGITELIRQSQYHIARQDSTFTGGNNRIFDWYYSSNDNSASPSSYNRLRLENAAGGDWYLRVQTTGDTPHLHIGPSTDTRLYLRNNDTDRAFVNSTGLHSSGDGVYDLGESGNNRWKDIYATTSLNSANVKFAGSSETITVGPKSGGNVTQVDFQRSKANAWLTTSQAPGIAAGSATWNLNNGGLIRQTMSANITSAPTVSNAQTDQILEVQIIQDATGSRTMTWPTNFKFAGGSAPTLTITANSRDIFRFRYDGTNWHEISRSMDVR